MKKHSILLTGVLMMSLTGCGSNQKSEDIYSFSGQRDEMRIINGVAVVDGSDGTFYGGTLEFKNDEFKNVKEYTTRFYIADEEEEWTILNNSVTHEDSSIQLTNQNLGKLSGQILRNNLDKQALEDFLFFEMIVKYEDGTTESFNFPMHVESVIQDE